VTGVDANPVAQVQGPLSAGRAAAPRRWNKGVWIRFGLAITPLVVFSILGIWGQHRW
jgi:hypothetical protein